MYDVSKEQQVDNSLRWKEIYLFASILHYKIYFSKKRALMSKADIVTFLSKDT